MSSKEYIFIKERSGTLVKILYGDITHIGSDKDYCLIYTTAKVFQILMRLETFSKCLPPDVFYRCHRCFIVNLDRIHAIQDNEIFAGSGRIPISNGKKDELLEKINYVHATYEDGRRVK